MPVSSPEEMFPLLAASLNRGDVAAALALYEDDAGFIGGAGELARGEAGLRAEFEAIIGSKATMSGRAVKTIVVKDLALVFVQYVATIPTPDGENLELSGLSTDVLRRQQDGAWLSVIDNPYGTALVAGPPVAQEIIDQAEQNRA